MYQGYATIPRRLTRLAGRNILPSQSLCLGDIL